MAFSISLLQIPPGEAGFNTAGFRNTLENHLSLLQRDNSTNIVPLDPQVETKYQGDFYGVLLANKIAQDLWWITMRMNGLTSPIDYVGYLSNILVPSRTRLSTMLTRYQNQLTIR